MTRHFVIVEFYYGSLKIKMLLKILLLLLSIYLPLTKKFYIALDKANWSQPKMEKSYLYKGVNIVNILVNICFA